MSEPTLTPDQPDDEVDGMVLPGPWSPLVAVDEDRVIDGEVVTGPAAGPVAGSWRPGGGVLEPRRPGPLVRVDAVRAAARPVGRALVHVGYGHAVWVRRMADAVTHAAIREQIRAARAAGDAETLALWLDRYAQAKAKRRQALLALPSLIRSGVIAAVSVTAVVGVLLLGVGILIGLTGAAGWTWQAYWTFLAHLGRITLALLLIAGQIGLYTAIPAWLLVAWRTGRASGTVPGWAMAPADRDETTLIVTPTGIGQALAHLGIAPLTKAISREGWQVAFDTPPVRVNNRGYQTVFSLPLGVTPDMIADKRAVLARNLARAPMEVWPSAAERAGYVDLWVADAGSAGRAAPDYPLLHTGTADVFAGIPLGTSQRGDVIAPPLVEANIVFGGMMGQGKSNAARVMMLDAALDPLAELWVFVFANNGDFDAYRPRLSRYVRGIDDSVAAAGRTALEELYAEVGRREERLKEIGAKKVTRGVAEKHPDLRPLVVLFSECHELFGHEEHGKPAADFAVQTLRRARKTAIILAFDTQSSRADAIPPKIVELVKLNACFAVKTWRSNDGFLGDGSFQAGIRATELRPGKDRGTSLLTGATTERFEILSWYYIAVDDETGWDAATDVIARAMTGVHPHIPLGERPTPAAEPVQVDHLADIAAALRGEKRVRTQIVLARLAEAVPALYEDWTFQTLSATLAAHHIAIRKSDGQSVIRAEDLHAAIALRDSQEEGNDQGEAPNTGKLP